MIDQDSQPTGELDEDVLQEEATPLPLHPVPVTIAGPVGVQHLPSRAAGGFQRKVATSDDVRILLGADPRRRTAKIICDLPFLYGTDQASVNQGVAARWPANEPLPLTHSDDVWFLPQAGATPASTTATVPDVTTADPAAGAEFSVTVPVGETWELESVHATLVTSAVAGNRRVTLVIDDGVNILAEIVAGLDHIASTTIVYSYTADAGYETVATRSGVIQQGIPRMLLAAGYRIRTVTDALDVGDNWIGRVAYRNTTTTAGVAATTGQVNVDVENWAD